jgi:hypothetical protein
MGGEKNRQRARVGRQGGQENLGIKGGVSLNQKHPGDAGDGTGALAVFLMVVPL